MSIGYQQPSWRHGAKDVGNVGTSSNIVGAGSKIVYWTEECWSGVVSGIQVFTVSVRTYM